MKVLMALWLACVSLMAIAQDAGLEERLVTVPLGAGSDLNLVVSKLPGSQPQVAALLFPGYPGVLKVQVAAGGAPGYQLRGNFLVRARRHLVSDKVLTVMVDCPTARWEHCDDAYRTSDQYAQDIGAAIDKLKADLGVSKIYLVGTSYGTVSSAFLALKLAGRIDGAVHTATFTDPRVGKGLSHGLPMRDFNWAAVKTDQLFVHHQDDPCPLTQYRSIVARKGSLPLVTVHGTKGARGEPCEAFSAHGFVGRERAVMLAISDWMLSRNVQQAVGADQNDE
ncbi:alpha/beta hydrolase [Cupriavidus lacunae]|uniref:Alpha/beta hydrolase n=1 Tax=Cupriavidus lacunae TaxID=2666307 RepID=A0A370P2Q4_9BURK|nr:alpha/beta hydrolase [Cupriavidus lacunae]RDK12088.1 alpha/beta hydrolase [Cupriavidus lacunae]